MSGAAAVATIETRERRLTAVPSPEARVLEDGVAELLEKSDKFARLVLIDEDFPQWFATQLRDKRVAMRALAREIVCRYGVSITVDTVARWDKVLLAAEDSEGED